MNKSSRNFWFSAKGMAALGLIAAASYFLLVEHREHVLPFLPYLILLACPLMHLFMHHGHGHQGSDLDGKDEAKKRLKSGGPHAR